MTVLFYDVGDHPAQFVGFRVARTIGHESHYRQKYFSLKSYSYPEAERLANQLDQKWFEEAQAYLLSNRAQYRSEKATPNIVVRGLRAYIGAQHKERATGISTHIYPCFLVCIPGAGMGDITFRTNVHGYVGAYRLAVEAFCTLHGLTDYDHTHLLGQCPDPEVFTEYLLKNLRKNGHKLPKKRLEALLGL